MLIFAARLFWVASMFVTLAFSQTQTMPRTQAAPSPSPSPALTRPATKQANIWQERVDEAIRPKKPSSVGGGIEILSDPLGVDFRPYLVALKGAVQKHWYPLIPESAMPPEMKSGKTVIKFSVMRDGRLSDIKVEQSSGDVALDRAAYGALVYSSPLAQLPASFAGDTLVIRASFVYNPSKQQNNSKESNMADEKKPSDKAQWNTAKDSGHL